MKRILAWVLLLTLVIGLFAGCKKTETEPTVGDYITAEAAMEYLKALYKNPEEAVKTPRDYERYGVIRVGGEPFEIVWTVEGADGLVKVVPGEDDMVTIDVDELCQEDTPYKLIATITDKGGNTVSHSWNFILPKAMDVGQVLKDAYALAPGESLPYEVTLTGKIIEINTMYNPEYQNITVTMVVEGYEEYPIECYRLKGEGVENLQVGNIITVTGTIKNYNGTIEFDSGCILESVEKGDAVDAPEDPLEIVAAAYALKDGESLPYVATLTGKVTEIDTPYDPDYNNITVVIEVEGAEGKPIKCYRLKGTGVDQVAVDDVITVMGIIKNYKGTIEFDSGCQMIDRISGGREAEKPSTDPVKIMSDAAKLGWGEHLNYYATLTGKVIDIESPYDSAYSNITVVISVDGYSNMPITCYRLKGNGVEKIARGDIITVKGIIENYKGKLEFGSGCTLLDRLSGGGVAKPETSNVKTIMTDAAKLSSGEHLDYYSSLTGKVIEIESPYDYIYGNITVVMEVSGYENMPITCYRLKSGAYNVANIAVGDTITVRGVLENYNGKLEYGSGCTLSYRKSGGGVAKPESSNAKDILADAAKLAEGEKLSYYANMTGKVTEIETPYDKEYGNISVYMDVTVDGKTTSMYCYRLKSGAYDVSKIAVGDTITVRGVIENYKGDIQFGSGSTLTKRVSGGGVAKPESSDAKAILADAAKLEDGEKLDYYANLTGKVTEIDTPYDKVYGNISVYMDVDGTSMYCYRLKSGDADVSKIAVGDTITVRGVIENYDGDIQFGSGSTLTKRVSGGGTVKPETNDQKTILADAAKLEANEKLDYYSSLTGKVIDIETPYDKVYGNITVVIELNDSAKTQITCYRMKDGEAKVSEIARNDTITVRGVLERYVNSTGTEDKLEYGSGCTLEKRVSGGGVAKPETDDQATILADAVKLGKNEHLDYYSSLTGKVTEIEEWYNPNYGNVTVVMDVDGTEITCYRMKSGTADASEVRIGDTITVRGVLERYVSSDGKKDKLEYGTGCTVEKLVKGTNPGDNMTPEEILTAAYALEKDGKLEGYYTLTGVISSVDKAYDSSKKSITVTMKVEGCEDMPIQCYSLKKGAVDVSNLKVGDTITVYGSIIKFYNKVQFDQGSFLIGLEAAEVEIPDTPVEGVATVVIYNPASGKALSSNPSSVGSYYLGGVDVTVSGTNVTGYGATEQWVLIDNGDGTYSFNYGGKNLAMGASYGSTPLGEVNDKWKVIDAGDGLYYIENVGRDGFRLEWYEDKNNFSGYQNDTTGDPFKFAFYVIEGTLPSFEQSSDGSGDTEEPSVPADGVTISFADKANRVTYTTEQQVWQQNGITVTNDKAASQTPVGDYADPARFYQDSKLTIEYPAMTRIVFNVAYADKVAGLVNSLTSRTDMVVTVNDLLVTVDLKEAADSLVIEQLVLQTRVRDITVYTGTTPPEGGDDNTDAGDQGGATSGGFQKVTSLDDVLSGGEFVIAVECENDFMFFGISISSKIAAVTGIDVTNNTVSGDNLPVWTIAAQGDGISLHNGTNYLAYKSGTSFESKEAAYEWDIQENGDGTFKITASTASDRLLAYQHKDANDDLKQRYGAYKENQSSGEYVLSLVLFKKVG